MNLFTCRNLLAMFALACITCAEAAPVNTSIADTDASSNATAPTHEFEFSAPNETVPTHDFGYDFEFSAPNCSIYEPPEANVSNRTHWDLAIGLQTLKEDLKDVLVSIFSYNNRMHACMGTITHTYKPLIYLFVLLSLVVSSEHDSNNGGQGVLCSLPSSSRHKAPQTVNETRRNSH